MRRRLARSTIECCQGWIGDFLRFIDRGGNATPARTLRLETPQRCSSASAPADGPGAVWMIYTHVMNKPAVAVRSPLDGLEKLSAGVKLDRKEG